MILEVNSVQKKFGGLQALRPLTMALEEGKITALIGTNGAGKTTTFNVITGFLRSDVGTIKFRGQRIERLKPEARSRLGIARSFQDLKLFEELTVEDNLKLAYKTYARLESNVTVEECLEITGLVLQRNTLAQELSYAEQKLLSIGRILASNAELLLLDEPTSGLDATTIDSVIKIIQDTVERKRTVFLIEHNMDIVRQLDPIVFFLHEGQLLAHGSFAEIANNKELTDLYFGSTY